VEQESDHRAGIASLDDLAAPLETCHPDHRGRSPDDVWEVEHNAGGTRACREYCRKQRPIGPANIDDPLEFVKSPPAMMSGATFRDIADIAALKTAVSSGLSARYCQMSIP